MENKTVDSLIDIVSSLNESLGELTRTVYKQREDIEKLQLQVEQLKNIYYGDK